MRHVLLFIVLMVGTPALAWQAPLPEAVPVVGGWSVVSAPDDDPGVQAAATAMLGKLPLRHARLCHVESALRQVVAGTNYRLTLRLRGGSRWSALVGHPLDGSFVVSEAARLP